MSNYYVKRFSAFVVFLALGVASVSAQDAPQQPSSLSAPNLMDEELAPEKTEFTIDPAILTPPENAKAEELFDFIDSLQDKLPQPTSQEELYQLVDAFSKTCSSVADTLLAMDDLTPEQKERAIQLKVVSLTTRANVDKSAADELEKFVDERLTKAKTDDELVKAYQLKLQVLAASNETDKIEALADEAFQREQEELQIFALEVKANNFVGAAQRTGEFDPKVFTFIDGVIEDKNRPERVKEKALELKLVALVIASELESDKEDESKRNPEYAKQAEELFEKLLKGDYSFELKKTVYQIRVQTLMSAENRDVEKINALADELAKQEDKELRALSVSVKGELLLNAAREDEKAIDALTEFADKVAEEAKTNELIKIPAVGLKVQTFVLKKDNDGLLKYLDEELALNPNEELKNDLMGLKMRLATTIVAEDPARFEQFKDLCNELKDDEQYGPGVAQIYSARFSSTLEQIAEKDGSLDEFNKALDQFKADLETCPRAITALLIARQSITEIGEKNNNDKLFDEVFDSVIDYCKTSKSEELNVLAQNLESYLAAMKEAQKQQEEAQKQQAEETEETIRTIQR